MKMSDVCLLLLSVCLFFSCQKDDEPDPLAEVKSDLYELIEINYFIEQGDWVDSIWVTIPDEIIYNRHSERIEVSLGGHIELYDSCFFVRETNFPFEVQLVDNIVVKTPRIMWNNELSFVQFNENEYKEEELLVQRYNIPISRTGLNPGYMIIQKFSYDRIRFDVTYVATFKGINTGYQIKDIKGKWKGSAVGLRREDDYIVEMF